MGLFEDLFGRPIKPRGLDVEGMANYRLGHGLEPIDWKRILLNQLRCEALGRQLSVCEQFMLESLSNV